MRIDKVYIIEQIKACKGVELINIQKEINFFVVKVWFNGNGKIKDDVCYLDYYIQINIPFNYPKELPECFEYSNNKIKNYHHLFANNSFCIGTNIEIRDRLSPNYNISKYVEMIGEYLVVYEYYKKYKIMPIEDRSHNEKGIYEGYKEMLQTDNYISVIRLLESVPVNNKMRNKSCPCGSNKRFKNCHFNLLQRKFFNKYIKKQMDTDLLILKTR